MTRALPLFLPLLLIFLAGCDSTDSEPSIEYAARGTCDGTAGTNVVSVVYTVDGGSTETRSVTMPWSITETIDDLGTDSLGNDRTSVELMVTCVGSGTQANSITGEILINGRLADSDIQSNLATVIVNVSATLTD